jgi:hypothetical protein
LISSAVFAILHANNPNASLISTLNILLAGIFLASGYLWTGQLAIPIGLHISWNFFQGSVFGFPVSGTISPGLGLIQIQQSGPPDWTGGAFGPEAGILGLIMIVSGTGLVYLYLKARYGLPQLATAISQPPDLAGEPATEEERPG